MGVGANVLSAGFIFAANDPSTGEDALPECRECCDTFPSHRSVKRHAANLVRGFARVEIDFPRENARFVAVGDDERMKRQTGNVKLVEKFVDLLSTDKGDSGN